MKGGGGGAQSRQLATQTPICGATYTPIEVQQGGGGDDAGEEGGGGVTFVDVALGADRALRTKLHQAIYVAPCYAYYVTPCYIRLNTCPRTTSTWIGVCAD